MSNQTDFPTKPFYIVSKIGGSNWLLTLTPTGAVVMRQQTATIDQLWTALPDPRGASFLKHVSTGRMLTCQLMQVPIIGWMPSGPLLSAQLDTGDPKQLWRSEALGGVWSGINAYLDWELKINVYGSNVHGTVGLFHWDGGADNEEWNLSAENGQVTVNKVVYDLAKATSDLDVPPVQCTASIADNRGGGTTLTSGYSLTRTVTTQTTVTHTESNTTGEKYTETFGVQGGIDSVITVTAQATFEQSSSKTISLTDSKTVSTTVTDTLSYTVSVPAGKVYSYNVAVYYGQVTVPYTAYLTFQSSTVGAAPVPITTTGVFTGVNSTKYAIVIKDITNGNGQPTLVAAEPVQ